MSNPHPIDNSAPDPARGPAQRLTTAALLRCAADGELTAEQQAQLDVHLAANPEDAARIRFECELRTACARTMSAQGAAPAGLRNLVAARVAQSAAAAATTPAQKPVTGQPVTSQPEVVVVGRIGPSRFQRLTTLAAAVLIGGAGLSLLVRGGMLTQGGEGPNTATAAVVLTTFLSDEHQRCSSSSGSLASKFRVTDASNVPGAVQKILGRPVSIESMTEAGFVFLGAGSCHVPDAEQSVHLMFQRPSKSRPGSGTAVSLFIENDTGRLDLEEGVTYAVEEGGAGSPRVIAWTHDGLVYYLVTRCAVSCDAAKDGLAAPESLAGLAR